MYRAHDTKLGRDVVGPAPNTLALVDRKGIVDRFNVPPHFYTHPPLSPDGDRLAVKARSDEGSDIWVYDLSDDTAIRRLTQEGTTPPLSGRRTVSGSQSPQIETGLKVFTGRRTRFW